MSEQQMTPAPRRIRSFQALRRPAAIHPKGTFGALQKFGPDEISDRLCDLAVIGPNGRETVEYWC